MATHSERKAETRRRLLDAASDLFARKGFHAVSIDAVADAADRTSGAVYAHFGGRDGLLRALLELWADTTTAELTTQLDSAPIEERLALIWRGLFSGDGDRADAWMLLEHEIWLYAARNPESSDALAGRYASARTGIGLALAQWGEAGEIEPPASVIDTSTLVLGLLFGLEMQRRIDPAVVPDKLAIDGLATLIGLAHDRGATPPSVNPTKGIK